LGTGWAPSGTARVANSRPAISPAIIVVGFVKRLLLMDSLLVEWWFLFLELVFLVGCSKDEAEVDPESLLSRAEIRQ
jgi:hypothetical protein